MVSFFPSKESSHVTAICWYSRLDDKVRRDLFFGGELPDSALRFDSLRNIYENPRVSVDT